MVLPYGSSNSSRTILDFGLELSIFCLLDGQCLLEVVELALHFLQLQSLHTWQILKKIVRYISRELACFIEGMAARYNPVPSLGQTASVHFYSRSSPWRAELPLALQIGDLPATTQQEHVKLAGRTVVRDV